MLLLLLLLHNVIAHDFQTDATYSVNVTDKCPDDGYYYKEDMSSNEVDGVCRLCFCKNNTAVCWLRPKSQCHTKMYIRMDKSTGRNRRSPDANVGVKYAVKNFFSKKTSHSCKPLGTTLSDDCPPDDWCLGCTVCDCERSGLWNCHILSFCSDRKLKKHYQNNNNTIKRTPVEIHSNLDNQNKINSTKMHRLARKMNVNHNNVKSWRQDFSTTYQYPYSAKHDDNVVVFQKDLVERKSKDIQGVRIKKIINENNVNARLNHKVVQRAMAAVQKIINKTERNFTNSTKHKVIHKRSMPQHDTKNNYQHQTTYVSPHMYKKSSPKRFRKKLSLNKITKEELRKKRIRRNTVNQANFTTTTIIIDYNNTLKSPKEKVLNEKPIKLNEYEYYKYNVVTEGNYDLANNDGIKIKHLSYNYTYGNKTIQLLKKTSQNLTGTNLCSSTNEVNLSIWHDVKDKKQKFKTINITDIKYLTTSENINNTLDYNQMNLQRDNNKIRFDDFGLDKEKGGTKESSETEDLTLINNMLNSKGILQHVFKKQPRNISKNRNIGSNFDFIGNLRSLFNNIFFKSKNGFYTNNDKLKLFDKNSLVETFCVKNVTCKIYPRDEIKLQIKINELNGEMYKVMETIKIIKKLLQQMINNKIEAVDLNFKPIMSNNCSKNGTHNKLKERQLQLYYIKDSIKTFIKSIGKFSYILQDIIYILTDKKNMTNNKQRLPQRPLRCTKTNEVGKSNSKIAIAEQRFKKIKKVLVDYNVLQNTFIKKVYNMLTKLESNLTHTEKKRKLKKPEKIDDSDFSTSLAIDTFTKNIINNLRKLKNLAKKLSSATTNRRKRSAVGDDDAIEYLLTIMEYLLKQNYPLDATPVNDGIDLLIDAIKHAPDIKPIKKKVLDASTTRTYPWPTEKATAETFSYVDNIYGLDSLDKDNNDTSGSDDNQITFSKSTDDGNDKVEDFQKLLHASKKISNSFRLSNFNNILKNAKLKSMSSTSATIVTTTPMIQYDFLKDNIAESDTETSVKIGPGIANDDRNDVDSFKSFNNENKPDNEEFPPNLIKLNGDSDVEIQVTLPTRTKATPRTTRKFHHMVRDKFDNPKIITYVGKPTKKSKFGWVDYDLGDDGSKKTERKIFSKSTERSTAPGGASKNRALSTADKNDVSAISKEIMDEEKRKQFYKLLPNSEVRKFTSRNMLDVTIKSEVDSDSKDTEGEDTYVNDVFPSYLT
ncbi:PREDICTED: uncharacterized protein MAL13P1.304-like [Papilio xuthus]|uniref:Uncharacterized protein MAL13P1.304-like n=1 Tax=Papilio xuthus TaxID=66420 RepID=A0AAJ7E775_PAPXU|nr:PREDICTED: uncharacterized protein MAL13P1.304-like [Papilio xuthus]